MQLLGMHMSCGCRSRLFGRFDVRDTAFSIQSGARSVSGSHSNVLNALDFAVSDEWAGACSWEGHGAILLAYNVVHMTKASRYVREFGILLFCFVLRVSSFHGLGLQLCIEPRSLVFGILDCAALSHRGLGHRMALKGGVTKRRPST